jgi:hypothetical protein
MNLFDDERMPNHRIMAMWDHRADYSTNVERKVARELLFDLSISKEAKARLDKDKTFGKRGTTRGRLDRPCRPSPRATI